MKNLLILIAEIGIAGILVALGLSGKKFLFIEGARAAAITLGVVGMAFCKIGIENFIKRASSHPLSILGCILGGVAFMILLTQIFKWNIIFIGNPNTALIVLAVVIVLKSVIGRFSYILSK